MTTPAFPGAIVAWTDKIDDTDYVQAIDINDAYAEIIALETAYIAKTTATLTYYVATSGLDSNDGLTNGTAFLTIQHAISTLPQIINHTITINVADGVYTEAPTITGFVGSGSINLIGNTTTPENCSVYNFVGTSCFCYLVINGFSQSSTTAHFMYLSKCLNFLVSYMVTTSAAPSFYGLYASSSKGEVTYSTFSNKYIGIKASSNGQVYSSNNTGTGNNYGLYVDSHGFIGKNGTQPFGTIYTELIQYGGRISGVYPDVVATSANITYYVATTGLNSNTGLTSGTAFLTVQHAINMLPQFINHTVIINVADGTYAETVIIGGLVGSGSLTVTGNVVTPTNVLVSNFIVTGCTISVNFDSYGVTTTTTHAIQISRSTAMTIANVSIVASALSYAGIYYVQSIGRITNCIISNHNWGIFSNNTSYVCSDTNTGSSNTIGLYCIAGSEIAKNSTQPAGTTAETIATGGLIR